MEAGLIDARLGGQLVKKRIALRGRGKRGGARTLVAYRPGVRSVFVYGFSKSEQENIDAGTLAALRLLARTLLDLSMIDLIKALQSGELVEIETNDDVETNP